jgi:hypothetical protein
VADDEMVTVRRDDLELLQKVCACYAPYPVTDDIREVIERTLAALGRPADGPVPGPEPGLAPDGQWCIVELLGHRERRGYVTQVERFGTPLLHIDLAAKLWDGDAGAWEEYAGAALYGMHPTTPAEVRATWEREKERERKQREWREQEAARWAALPSGGSEPAPYDGDEDLDDEDGPAF